MSPRPPSSPRARFRGSLTSVVCRRRCVDAQYVCDGDADCPGGADEDSSAGGPCGEPAARAQVPCSSALPSLSLARVVAANVTCGEDQLMKCDTNRCISKSWICDGLKGEFKGVSVCEGVPGFGAAVLSARWTLVAL